MRLRFLRPGEQFSFVCDPEHVEKMLRVLDHNGGKVEEKRARKNGVFFTVSRESDAE